jgi:hypothetical protein
MCGPNRLTEEDPEVAAMRQALGAVAAASPAAYWVYTDAEGAWCARRNGYSEEHRFAGREEALAFVRRAVVRCVSYCLFLQGKDGTVTRKSFNW